MRVAHTVLGIDGETCRVFGMHESHLRREGRLIENFDRIEGLQIVSVGD